MENKLKECLYCGTKFVATGKNKYCTYRCGILYNQRLNRTKNVSGESISKKYKHNKWEGVSEPKWKPPKRTKMTLKKWNALPASERWEMMTLTELSGEIARMFPGKSFAQVRLLKEQGKLPEDFGKRTENNG